MKKNFLVIVTTYVNGVCRKIDRKYPQSFEGAKEMVEKLQTELPKIKNGSYKIEIVNRF